MIVIFDSQLLSSLNFLYPLVVITICWTEKYKITISKVQKSNVVYFTTAHSDHMAVRGEALSCRRIRHCKFVITHSPLLSVYLFERFIFNVVYTIMASKIRRGIHFHLFTVFRHLYPPSYLYIHTLILRWYL